MGVVGELNVTSRHIDLPALAPGPSTPAAILGVFAELGPLLTQDVSASDDRNDVPLNTLDQPAKHPLALLGIFLQD